MDPRIEPAEEQDLGRILQLVHRAYAHNAALGFHFVGATESPESLREDWTAGHVYTLRTEGGLAGTIRIAGQPQEGFLQIWRLCVDPDVWRRGLGGRLLRFAESEARKRSLRSVRLDTAKPFVELVRWYQRRGYRITGETRFPDVNYDSVLLEKEVTA